MIASLGPFPLLAAALTNFHGLILSHLFPYQHTAIPSATRPWLEINLHIPALRSPISDSNTSRTNIIVAVNVRDQGQPVRHFSSSRQHEPGDEV
ncbi:hypothetical protein ARMGADRAFT_305119 [Armillaria gallica]|uniref:Uncharacterized protein n=1 Tax=Armillaria gallica TaxID=47427 RepID=A0A2H3DGY3_ARMGA|nr:hypothetical protein ARMGADRAFT_305119 [Armillaria gallica]